MHGTIGVTPKLCRARNPVGAAAMTALGTDVLTPAQSRPIATNSGRVIQGAWGAEGVYSFCLRLGIHGM